MAKITLHKVDHPSKADGLVETLQGKTPYNLQVTLVPAGTDVEIHVSTRKRGVTSAQLARTVLGELVAYVCRPNRQYALLSQRGPRRPYL